MSFKAFTLILISMSSLALSAQATVLTDSEIKQYETCAPKALNMKSKLNAEGESIRNRSNKEYRDLQQTGVGALDGWNTFLYTTALNRVISRTRKLDFALEHLQAGESLQKSHKRAIISVCNHRWDVWSYVTE